MGQKLVICGPSGSGKSTLIRCINQLEKHQSGYIHINGVDVSNGAAGRSVIRDNVGMVFQQFNLFPHLTILENLTLGPIRGRGLGAAEASDLAMHYLERVKIPEQRLIFLANWCIHPTLMAQGKIVEMAPPNQFFLRPKSARCKLFLSQILRH